MNNKSKIGSVVAVVLGIVLLICIFVWLSASRVSGTEFSPDDFSQRRFSYSKDPIFGWVIRKRTNSIILSELAIQLRKNGYLPKTNSPETWHLVSEEQSEAGGVVSKDCDARFLVKLLGMNSSYKFRSWSQWNTDHPKLAAKFWPLVSQMAKDEMYLAISEVVRFPSGRPDNETVDSFVPLLNQVAAAAYFKLAKIDADLERWDRAIYRLQAAIKLDPTEPAKTLLKKCQSNQSNQPE